MGDQTGDQVAGPTDTHDTPLLRVVNPDATPEEIAALVAVFSALGQAGAAVPERPRPAWSDPARGVRRPHLPGGGAWRASGLPG